MSDTDTNQTANRTPPEGFLEPNYMMGFSTHVGPFYVNLDHKPYPSIGFYVEEHHINPAQICHGGMLMTMWDMSVGFATMSVLTEPSFLPSVNFNCDFLMPAKLGEWIQSEMDFIKTTRRTGFASGFLTGPNGPVLRGSGISKISSANSEKFKVTDDFHEKRRDFKKD